MRKRSDPNRASWTEQLNALWKDVAAKPAGPDRDAAEKKAKQLEAAIQMKGWLGSELRPPE